MVKLVLTTSSLFNMNEYIIKFIIFSFMFVFIIGLFWGLKLYIRKNLVKKIIGKFYYKYIIIIMLICLIISAIVTGIIQFVCSDILKYAFLVTICLVISSLEWAFIHDKISLLKFYPNIERLHAFFEYLKKDNISYLKYTEIITWFSRWIHFYFKKKSENNKNDELIKKLDLLLRPNNNGMCLAFHHKTDFTELCKTSLTMV